MIELEHVTKRYKRYTAPYNSLKSYLLHRRQYHEEMAKIDELCVVNDLTMTIGRGEVVCVVGRNGAGKSTLAKLIAQTIEPTSGKIIVRGRVVPFLELGVAFNSELPGRDNAIMNGVLLGMSKSDVRSRMNDIFTYAQIEAFMETPLKFYSSGMLMRLAFSIGMHSNGDIYIFDEILAVGDANFQKKCFDSFQKLVDGGKTIILITHDLNLVSRYATRILFLENGKHYDMTDRNRIRAVKDRELDQIFEWIGTKDAKK